jgi:cytochrome c oxidase subunit 2
MRRDLTIAVILWVVISAAAVGVAAFIMNPFPAVGAEEASLIDDAFMVMTYMAAPVFAIVITVLVFGVYRWRASGPPEEGDEGPALLGDNWFPKAWLVVTASLAVVVMIFPGLTGLADLRDDDTSDLRVEVTGFPGWQWQILYPDQGIRLSSGAGDELVLPADTRIQFDVTSLDVIHSFWIPAFRQKIDAVPGQTNTLYATVTDTGDYDDDVAYRIQCAELCGLNHSDMTMKVSVVDGDEWSRWLASKSSTAAKVQ